MSQNVRVPRAKVGRWWYVFQFSVTMLSTTNRARQGAKHGRMIQFSSINPWFSIHVDLTIFVWSLNLRSFEQQHQFNRKIKVKQVFWRNLLQFPWSRNIFARHVASRILWRSGFTGSNPILVLLLQKFKKVAQKVIKKRVPFVSNTRG